MNTHTFSYADIQMQMQLNLKLVAFFIMAKQVTFIHTKQVLQLTS